MPPSRLTISKKCLDEFDQKTKSQTKNVVVEINKSQKMRRTALVARRYQAEPTETSPKLPKKKVREKIIRAIIVL